MKTLPKVESGNLANPGGLAAIVARLEAEGHTVVQKGKRAFVRDFEKALAHF